MPLREGISKRASENLMCWSSIPSMLVDVEDGTADAAEREKGEAVAKGSATALGTSSTGMRGGEAMSVELEAVGMSNFRRPS